MTGEGVRELGDRSMEIIQSEEQREKRVKNKKTRHNIKQSNMCNS